MTNDGDIKKAIISKVGRAEYDEIRPWLNDVASEGRTAESKQSWDPALRRVRFGVTMGQMGFKMSTMLMQVSGLSNAAAETGTKNVMKGLRTVITAIGDKESAQQMWDFVEKNSKIMGDRINTMDREMRSAFKMLEGKDGLFALTQETSMKGIGYMQLYAVDLPSWYGAYYKGVAEAEQMFNAEDYNSLTEYRAAIDQYGFKLADWSVENVQGSGLTKDLPRIMRNKTEGTRS